MSSQDVNPMRSCMTALRTADYVNRECQAIGETDAIWERRRIACNKPYIGEVGTGYRDSQVR